ncbi:hypothetical protein [Ottowia sp.]|uniref:hypothetical protein n=1 Tax=Ottowia sp. TaxID=1898956 RepID=UPI0025D6A30E|nr:hypothetical protein [Ottowia sp.]MBK6616450.1 hypothetical protein [Ottowia sp.]
MTDHTSTQALSLRVQALALLQQAQELDGLHPFLIHHSHQYIGTSYLVWAQTEPDEETAAKMLDSQYEPEKNEGLHIESGVTLEEIAGTSVAHRVPDVLASDPSDGDETSDTFPQAYHTAINRMDYGPLKELLEEFGFAVNPSESEDELREAVRSNLLDGTIPRTRIDISAV